MRLAGLFLAGLLTQVQAQTAVSWSSGSSGNWSTGGNWTGSNAPASSLTTNYAYFNNATGVTVTADSNWSIAGIELGASAGAYTISKTSGPGRTLTLGAYGIRSYSSADQTITGSSLRLTLGAASSFRVEGSGALTISTTNNSIATTATNTLTLSGAGSGLGTVGSVIAGAGSVTKSGSSTWLLTGTNTYTGKTIINGGVLAITNETGLGGNPGAFAADQLTLNGGTLRTQTSAVTINDANRGITLGASGGTFDTVTNLTISNVITGAGSLTKTGTGQLTLSGVNTYSGATNIGTAGGADAGTLILGANNTLPGTTVNIYGGTLDLNTRTDTIGALNLGGGTNGTTASVTGTTGTLTLGGNVTYSATNNPNGAGIYTNISLGGADRTFTVGDSSAAATDLTLGNGDFTDTITIGGNTLIIDGAGNTLINAIVGASGNTGGFTKNGSGTVTFYGDRNYYTGTTTVNDGTLILDTLNTPTDETIRGNLVIGDNSGAADSAKVQFGDGSNKIANTSQITINSDGLLNLGTVNDTVGAITLSGGHISTTTGVLTLNGNITTTANAAGRTAVIDGYLQLGNTSRTFTVANDTPAVDLLVNANINFGSIVKEGTGTMVITSDNTIGYGGTTDVNAGVLNIRHAVALGQTGVNDPTKGTSVASGAALQLEGGVGGLAVGTEALTLTGTGVANDGALRNISGDNSWAGAVSLGTGGARINTDAGSLTITGAVTATNQNLTVGGEANTRIDGAIGTGSGTLTKDGNGTLTLTGDNTYSGTTSITDGVVNIRHGSALGSTGAGTTVSSGAALQIQNNITVGAEALTLTGTGVSGDGALRNISGNNTWQGQVTVGTGGTRINSDAGHLTLAGNITAGSESLAMGGAGDMSLAGSLSGSGSLTKDGAGLLEVDSSLGFGGTINLTAGTLQFNVDNAFSGTMNISGGTLRLADTADLTLGTLNITGNSVIDFAGTANILSVTNFSISAGVVLTIRNWQNAVDYFFADNWAGAVYDTTGTAPMNRIVFDTDGSNPTTYNASQTKWQSYDEQITPVPEPSTYGALLLGAGGAFFGWRRWRRSRAVARA